MQVDFLQEQKSKWLFCFWRFLYIFRWLGGSLVGWSTNWLTDSLTDWWNDCKTDGLNYWLTGWNAWLLSELKPPTFNFALDHSTRPDIGSHNVAVDTDDRFAGCRWVQHDARGGDWLNDEEILIDCTDCCWECWPIYRRLTVVANSCM